MKKIIALLSALACIAAIPAVPIYTNAEENVFETIDGLTYKFFGDDGSRGCFLVDVDKNCTTITIPAEVNGATVINCEMGAFDGCNKLEEINVDEDSEYLQSIDGVLFYKPNQSIMCYPSAKAGADYVVP